MRGEPQEVAAGDEYDREIQPDAELHEEGPHKFRQKFVPQDRLRGLTDHLGMDHILVGVNVLNGASYDPHHARHEYETHGGDQWSNTRSKPGDKEQRDEQRWNGQQYAGSTADQVIDAPTLVACNRSGGPTDGKGKQDRSHGYQHDTNAAGEEAAQYVASQIVGAQPETIPRE